MRNIPNHLKSVQKKKSAKTITDDYIKKVEKTIEKEEKIMHWIKESKENKISVIVKYLYDLRLMPEFRICHDFKCNGKDYCKGTIKDIGKKIEVKYVATTDKNGYFTAKIDGKYVVNDASVGLNNKFYRQKHLITILKEIIEEERLLVYRSTLKNAR